MIDREIARETEREGHIPLHIHIHIHTQTTHSHTDRETGDQYSPCSSTSSNTTPLSTPNTTTANNTTTTGAATFRISQRFCGMQSTEIHHSHHFNAINGDSQYSLCCSPQEGCIRNGTNINYKRQKL